MSKAVGKPRRIDVPGQIRSLASLADVDSTYACEISASADDERSAEQWARAVFEGAPTWIRSFIRGGWIVGLRLRLAPRSSPAHVLGWTIVSTTPKAIVLGIDSFALTTRLVVRIEGRQVVHATFVRYDRTVGRVLWAAAFPIHRRVVPYLLRRAANDVGLGTAGPGPKGDGGHIQRS